MASVNDWVAREYFESLGFLTRQPRKYQMAARSEKTLREEVDLIVVNPSPVEGAVPEIGLWGSKELNLVSRAIVGVRGWHTERFSPAVLRQAPKVYRFAGSDVVDQLRPELGEGPVVRLLCLSDLPASEPLRKESLAVLKEEGVDGVLLYSSMLRELISEVEVHRNYEKSDLLQLLRILKNYDLLKGPQMELFKTRRPRKG